MSGQFSPARASLLVLSRLKAGIGFLDCVGEDRHQRSGLESNPGMRSDRLIFWLVDIAPYP